MDKSVESKTNVTLVHQNSHPLTPTGKTTTGDESYPD